MPRTHIYIKIGIEREEVTEYPDWQQGLPQHTSAEAASYYLGFLKKILELGPGLFMDDSHLPQFNALLERTLHQFNSQNIEAGLGEVENQILPAITSMVKPENRAGFRDIVNLVEFHALFPGEYYYTPSLDEIMEIKSCTKVTGTGHIISGLWKCNKAKVKCHIEKIEQEEEEE